MTTSTTAPARPNRPHRAGPPLPVPALAWAGLTIAGAALHPGTRPSADAASIQTTLQSAPLLAMVSAALLVASAVPLAVWAATVHQRLHALGARVAGPTIGLVGGVTAVVALAVSGLASWTAGAVAPAADATLARAFTLLAFGAGGPLFAAAFGLLIAGVAVPALILRLLPRWLALAGLVIAVFGAVAVLVLLVPALGPLLPVVRFGGLLWLVAASIALPLSRTRATA
ncbi:hypothetical protein DFQ14_102369 [Halopolyspora algeriensis]|uniref:DUF4386 domain-containing protein n=1 Tax=Halopolyspora algeriensis TaxID=1500506 RepID=A0A368VXN1_9ACTN|nr:DUF4386 domain-containing protein [Halopolyspora algeriensis]RCW46067.1 hypothetical protein DFQ14_102369 [Halopolyspora algeriensis]TQM55473.1 hypothetical protein FHU43_0243 [Halopolyspora algeriensis]